MQILELAKIVASILVALGGGGAIVAWFSSLLGRVWADRLMEKQKAHYQRELEDFKTQATRLLEREKADYQQALEDFKAKLNRESDRTGQTLREKISLYKDALPPLVDLILHYHDLAPTDITPKVMKEFEQKRLTTSALLAIFAPLPVFEAYNSLIDYVYDCLEAKRAFVFSDFRTSAFALLSEIRRDIGIGGDELVYKGPR